MDGYNDSVDNLEGNVYAPPGADTFKAIKSQDFLSGGNGSVKDIKKQDKLQIRPTIVRLNEIYEDKSKKKISVPKGSFAEQFADPSWLTYEERSELQSSMATELFKAGIPLPRNVVDLPKAYLDMLSKDKTQTSEETKRIDKVRIYTTEEITKIRSSERTDTSGHPRKVREYSTADGVISVYRQMPDGNTPNQAQAMQDIYLHKKSEEAYAFETLLVNALNEQLKIAEIFDIPKDKMKKYIVVGYEPSKSIADSDGYIHAQALARRVDYLQQHGLNEDQMTIELAGHIFHEAIHHASEKGLLGDKSSFGEVTTVTAQLAYHLVRGYNGPTSYDGNRFINGLGKIKKGLTDILDYDIATTAAMIYLNESLTATFPHYTVAQANNPYTACEDIIAHLSDEEYKRLAPALKQAIMDSTDEVRFRGAISKAREIAQATEVKKAA